jgi:hypothetical protein
MSDKGASSQVKGPFSSPKEPLTRDEQPSACDIDASAESKEPSRRNDERRCAPKDLSPSPEDTRQRLRSSPLGAHPLRQIDAWLAAHPISPGRLAHFTSR